ncbi:hypothetical protein [Sphingomonas arenae]|uniref:hypothetical protein n=1 Tax=Sphingomonas arenae TaxID=2812555 RepID=UPI00196718CA|nr:hypothetical protein [Sphingomonas arenae]
MTVDRGELAGTGAAILFHFALVAALTTTLAGVAPKPEPPAMEVEMVDAEEIGLIAAAPQPVTTPPPSQAPEIAQAPPAEVAPPPPLPTPAPPRIDPVPAPRPAPTTRPTAQPRPTPARPTPAPRVSRLGDDFLKGLPDAPSRSTAKPAAATFNAEARASIDGAIKRQIQPCADDEPFIGAGADRIRLTLNLRLAPSGRLQSLNVVLVAGDDEENARYVPLVEDQAKRVFAKCSPLRLPAELYRTPQGGWSNINMTYRVQ